LRQQYSRYTPEMIERVTGIPKEQFLKAADLFTSVRINGDTQKVATIMYAVGWTQHSFGTQIIRTAAMLQLLLGNVGRAGGGVNALRGHSNIQGATDMAGLSDSLPGYLKAPIPAGVDFKTYMARVTPSASKPAPWDSFNYYSNTPKFTVSFKALYGDAAKKENDWVFYYLPKVDRNYSWTEIWDNMYRGSVKGMLAFCMNGACIGPDSQKISRLSREPIGRILCPACGEESVEKLAIYTAEQFGHVRVEACDTCGCYIKTVDLTKNGRAVPIVDELATIPLNLWVREHGYVKVQANMLGI
jgi:anaerobic selenocysteine-containing dehydrogenase